MPNYIITNLDDGTEAVAELDHDRELVRSPFEIRRDAGRDGTVSVHMEGSVTLISHPPAGGKPARVEVRYDGCAVAEIRRAKGKRLRLDALQPVGGPDGLEAWGLERTDLGKDPGLGAGLWPQVTDQSSGEA